jgi:microcystin-dependent protein
VAEDRPVQDPVAELAQLRRDFEDFKTTMAVRAGRLPVGSVSMMPWPTPPAGMLYAQGQTVLRADYPVLWQVVQDRGGVITGLYTAGDGATTFGLPDWRGRTPIGVGALGADTYSLGQLVGAARVGLTEAQLAAHGHTASSTTHTHDSAPHEHASSGNHDDHNYKSLGVRVGIEGDQYILWTSTSSNDGFNGAHTHGNSGGHTHGNSGGHSHTVGSTGSGAEHENRQPSFALHYAIWT